MDGEPWIAWADASAAAFARKFHVEFDDAQQAARFAAWKAHHQWRQGTPVTLERFVRTKAFFAIVDLMRQAGYGSAVDRNAYARGERFDPAVSLDAPASGGSVVGDFVAFERSHAAPVGASLDVHRALALIPAREATIVKLVDLEGFAQSEVAEALGVTESRISQIRTKAFSRMRPLLAA